MLEPKIEFRKDGIFIKYGEGNEELISYTDFATRFKSKTASFLTFGQMGAVVDPIQKEVLLQAVDVVAEPVLDTGIPEVLGAFWLLYQALKEIPVEDKHYAPGMDVSPSGMITIR